MTLPDSPRAQPPPERTRDPERTRAALLAAAGRLFAERGYEGTTTERIARAAGVNKAMISYHFGGKAGLHSAFLREAFGEAADRLDPLAQEDAPAPILLRRFIRGFAEVVSGRPTLPAAMMREALSGGRHLDREVVAELARVFATLATIVRRGVAAGELRDVEPLHAHLAVVGSLVFFHGTAPLRERLLAEGALPGAGRAADDADGFVRHVEELVVRGLAAGGAPDEESR